MQINQTIPSYTPDGQRLFCGRVRKVRVVTEWFRKTPYSRTKTIPPLAQVAQEGGMRLILSEKKLFIDTESQPFVEQRE